MADADPRSGDALQARARRRAWLALGYRERLEWLEEAKRFAERALAAAARRRRSEGSGSPGRARGRRGPSGGA